jgi:hypothetical protein
VTAAERAFWLRVQQRAARLEPDVGNAILKALDLLRTNFSISEVARAIEKAGHGAIPPEIFPQTLLDRAFIPVSESVADALRKGTAWGATELPGHGRIDGKVAVGFNVLDQNVRDALETLDDKAIGTLEDAIHDTVKAIIKEGLETGRSPIQTATLLRDTIGLAPNQVDAVQNYRNALEANSAHALDYELRDHRSDSVVEKAIAAGEGLSAEKIDKLVEAYQRGMLRFNAESNARTLTLDTMKAGQRLAVDQAIKQGIYKADNTWKRWRGTLDDREREEHLAMEGQTVPYDETFSNGEDQPGDSTFNCRCVAVYFQSAASHGEEDSVVSDAESADTTGFDASAVTTVENAAVNAASTAEEAFAAKGSENDRLEKLGLPANSPERRKARRDERARLKREGATQPGTTIAPNVMPQQPRYIPSETAAGATYLKYASSAEAWSRIGPDVQELFARSNVGFQFKEYENNLGTFFPSPNPRFGEFERPFSSYVTISTSKLSAQDRTDVVLHEMGHAVDWSFNRASGSTYGGMMTSSFSSDGKAFMEAVSADFKAGAEAQWPSNASTGKYGSEWLSYTKTAAYTDAQAQVLGREYAEMIQRLYSSNQRETALSLDTFYTTTFHGSAEIFADAFAALNGAKIRQRYAPEVFQRAFPNLTKFLRDLLARLPEVNTGLTK